MPQKQPPARTAVCSPFVVASGASTDGFGKARPAVAVAVLQAGIVIKRPLRGLAHKARDMYIPPKIESSTSTEQKLDAGSIRFIVNLWMSAKTISLCGMVPHRCAI